MAAETFDWKGKAGEEFAKKNPADVEGVDRNYMGKATEVWSTEL